MLSGGSWRRPSRRSCRRSTPRMAECSVGFVAETLASKLQTVDAKGHRRRRVEIDNTGERFRGSLPAATERRSRLVCLQARRHFEGEVSGCRAQRADAALVRVRVRILRALPARGRDHRLCRNTRRCPGCSCRRGKLGDTFTIVAQDLGKSTPSRSLGMNAVDATDALEMLARFHAKWWRGLPDSPLPPEFWPLGGIGPWTSARRP